MKQDDEDTTEPSDEELREAAALAEALEGATTTTPGATPPDDALEAAALLRHARAPMTVPPAVEPIVTARAAPALEAFRTRGRRRARVWIATSLLAPAAAAVWLLTATITRQAPPSHFPVALPAPTADLLSAQAQAARGGPAGAALARLDVEMRAYRRQYHAGLRRQLGETP